MDGFENDIELSITICILKILQLSGYGTKHSKIRSINTLEVM